VTRTGRAARDRDVLLLAAGIVLAVLAANLLSAAIPISETTVTSTTAAGTSWSSPAPAFLASSI
jgi:hypothetical protein